MDANTNTIGFLTSNVEIAIGFLLVLTLFTYAVLFISSFCFTFYCLSFLNTLIYLISYPSSILVIQMAAQRSADLDVLACMLLKHLFISSELELI